MSGESLLPVAEAQVRLLTLAAPLAVEAVPLAEAGGRYLAKALTAPHDQPPFDASAMDGYALGPPGPVPGVYEVIGTRAAGGQGGPASLAPGQALRLFTGAPVPQGAMRVLPQEEALLEGARLTAPGALESLPRHIRPRGADFAKGAIFAPKRLSPRDLALLAAMNFAALPLHRRPRVTLIPTGDELVAPGTPLAPGQIVSSTPYGLKALVESEGGQAQITPPLPDDLGLLAAALDQAAGASDLIVTLGGASVGAHDLMALWAQKAGAALAFHRIAMRPGKPLLAGRHLGTPLLGLPGNPVSALVAAELFLRPFLRALQGDPAPLPRFQPGLLVGPLPANGPRAHYLRATFLPLGQGEAPSPPRLQPLAEQDSSFLTPFAGAEALLLHPPHAPALPKGSPIPFLPL